MVVAEARRSGSALQVGRCERRQRAVRVIGAMNSLIPVGPDELGGVSLAVEYKVDGGSVAGKQELELTAGRRVFGIHVISDR